MTNPITRDEMDGGQIWDIKTLIADRKRRISVERQMRYEGPNGWDIYSLDARNLGLVLNRDPFKTRKEAKARAVELFGKSCFKMLEPVA